MKPFITLLAFASVGFLTISCSRESTIQSANWRPRIILTSAEQETATKQSPGMPHGLSRGDVARIKATVPTIQQLIVWRTMPGIVKVPTTQKTTSQKIIGTTDELSRVADVKIVSGRFINAADDSAAKRVLVLDESLAQELFGSESSIGRSVDIADKQFEVVGVFGNLETNSELGERVRCIVPIKTMRAVFGDLATTTKDGQFNMEVYELSGCIVEVQELSQLESNQKIIENILQESKRNGEVTLRNNLPSR